VSQQRSWALSSYLKLSKAMTPLWRLIFRKRLQRGKETSISLSEKWMLAPGTRPAGQLVWGHAVGVGEAMALAGFFAQMGKLWPEANFLITTTARTSGDALHNTGLPARCMHQFAPIDTPATVKLFLDHWQPALAVWCEMDLWPALIHATEIRGIPRVLINARLNEASMAKRKWGRWIYESLLPGFNTIWAPNNQSRQALIKLGARPESVVVTGNIKAMSPPLGCNMNILHNFERCLADRPVWLLASSHPTEEDMALQAHRILLMHFPSALLLIAPRNPARGKEVLGLCPEGTLLRSNTPALPEATQEVYVADTIGEMGLWYRLAPVVMMGGSWAPIGGHNPYEPISLSCAVVHGPNVWNFSESYNDLGQKSNCKTADTASDIAVYVLKYWNQKTQRLVHQDREIFKELKSLIALAKQ
jgi:3-deoxy-D-manno-octulosonic-acid transferase